MNKYVPKGSKFLEGANKKTEEGCLSHMPFN